MPKDVTSEDPACWDMNWTRDVPMPIDQSCTYDKIPCDQINDTEVAEHKGMEEETSNGYHTPPGPERAVGATYEN